jgi:hypothetical protein
VAEKCTREKPMKRIILISVNGILIFILLAVLVSIAPAQTNGTDWSEPVNLSNSGSATSPKIVIDSNQRIHVVWQDIYEGLKYVWNEEGTWSLPITLDLPFKDSLDSLLMIPDQNGNIHAAWMDPKGNLSYNRVLGQNFAFPPYWTAPELISGNTANFDMTLSPQGRMYLAYILANDSADSPAGVYTRFANEGSLTWSNPRLVQSSPYFRGLDRTTAQVSILAQDRNNLTVAWDETPLERVFQSASSDGGKNWAAAVEVDRRNPEDGSSQGPSQPVLAQQDQASVLVWQAGHQGIGCALYAQGTSQAGQSWSDPQVLPEPFDQNCPDSIQVLSDLQDGTWFFAGTPEGFHLFTWQGNPEPQGSWSSVRLQSGLNGFSNPDTYRPVVLGCQQAAISENNIYVVGCESGKNGDIWLLSRTLEEYATWFPSPTPPPAWSDTEQLSQANQPFTNLILLPDQQGRIHAFWSVEKQNSIFYALWDTTAWTTPQRILFSLAGAPQGMTVSLVNSGTTLMLVWSEQTSGRLYNSLAPLSQATDANVWTIPQTVLPEGEIVTDPQTFTTPDGTLYIGYIKPFNEGRGVCLLHNTDPIDPGLKINWSESEQVFDAASAGWASLSDLQLSQDEGQKLHLQWLKRGLPPESASVGLYYMHSTSTLSQNAEQPTGWSELTEITRGEVTWHQLLRSSNGILQRAWQERQTSGLTLTHQFSNDAGDSWSQSLPITSVLAEISPAAMAVDHTGNVNIVLISPDQGGSWQLQNWLWTAQGTWTQVDFQQLPDIFSVYTNCLSATFTNQLALLYAGTLPDNTTSSAEDSPQEKQNEALLFMLRAAEEIQGSLPGTSILTVQPSSLATTNATYTPVPPTNTPTPVPTFSKDAPTSSGGILSEYGLVIAGSIPALILVILIIVFVFRRFYKYQGE